MREIKFRAWNPYQNRMMPTVSAHNLYSYPAQCFDYLMQFTGLLDKNGKEVYDLDLVRRDYSEELFVVCWDGLPYHHNWCAVPVSKYGQFRAHQETGEGSHPVESDALEGLRGDPPEVVGNIHEHSELLEQK